nr:hypothetical protein [Tanacetum cinerariifolium]
EDPPPEVSMADNRTMAELLQAPTEGYEDAIVIPEITANNFKLKHGGNFLDKTPRECLKIIESNSKVHQSRAKAVVAKVSTSSSTPAISSDVAELKDMVKALLLDKKNQSPAPTPSTTPAPVKAVKPNCVTCGGAHSYQNCPATHKNAYRDNIQEYVSQAAAANYYQGNTGFRPQMVANQIRPPGFPPHQNNQNNFNQNRGGNFNQSNFNPSSFNQGQLHRPRVNQALVSQAPIPQTQRVSQTDFESYVKANDAILRNMQSQDMMSKFVSANTASSSGSGTLPGNTITNPKEELKGITIRSGVAYQGPKIPSLSKQGTEVTKDQVQTPSSQNTAPVRPSVIQHESQALVFEPVVATDSASMPNLKPSIPYPSRRDNEKRPLIEKKEKLSEMARTMMNEHCSAVILNKLPRKFGDPEKFLIPCEFPGMDECLALADLDASINLMPLSVWEWLSLPELTPTCMTLELADRSVSKPIGIAKDVSFKVGVFHFPADFVGELTLRIRNEAITYNLDQTVRYSANYNQITANKIDVIESACEEYSQEVLGFSNVTASGTPTPHNDPIVSATSPPFTLFRDSDLLLFEEADAFLGLEDDPNTPKINPFYYDPKGEILLLEAILNSEPSPPIPNQEQNLPSFKEELKAYEAQTVKSSVDEPPEGINPEFCTHKILMEEDYKSAVQHQRRVNPKIHDGFSGYFQIPIDPRDQEKTMFTAHMERLPTVACLSACAMLRALFKGVLDTKGAENLAADHLSRLENSYENVLDPKEINETFPLETLSMVTFRGDSSASWFTDFANYHAGNFIVNVCAWQGSSRHSRSLPQWTHGGNIMVQTSLPKRSLMPVSSGPPFTKMPTSLLKIVTRANDKGTFRNGMRCLKIPSKHVKSLTFGASIL